VISAAEAETVRHIFKLYLEIGSVRRLKERLDELGCATKQRLRNDGTPSGGKPFTRGHLYWLLSNPIYAGLISHRGRISDGQHEAIIDRETWEATQRSLAGKAPFERRAVAATNASTVSTKRDRDSGSLLSGLLYDETGDRLSPSHAVKNGIRYRYYVSQRLMRARRKDATGWRLPAKALEDVVVGELAGLLEDHRQLQTVIEADRLTIPALEALAAKAKSLRDTLRDESGSQVKAVVRSILDHVTLEPGKLTLAVNRKNLTAALGRPSTESDASRGPLLWVVPFCLRRRGVEAKLIVRNGEARPASIDKNLVEAISQAYTWLKQLSTGAAKSAAEIAAGAGIDDGEVSRVLPLAFLAPDIVKAIFDGHQPATLTARYLKRLKPVPTSWSEQRRILGFCAANRG
jgi:site-specific DNA recombinase